MIEYPALQPQFAQEPYTLFGDDPNNCFLDFAEKARVQELTLEKLKRTNHENNARTGEPLLNGIYHDALIEQILGIAESCGFQPTITGLFAAQNKERKMQGVSIIKEIEKKYWNRAIEAHILRRIFANIRLVHPDKKPSKTYETCIAVAYHQRGIQVGFGTRVIYCQNQMLLNADCYVTTYPDANAYKVVGLIELFEIVREWLLHAEQLVGKEQAILERWKNQKINHSQLMYVIGRLTEARVRVDSSRLAPLTKVYPLGSGQIGSFAEGAFCRLERSSDNTITIWDIYDIATNLYKPWLMPEFPNILPQNKAMAEFTLEMERIFQTGMVEMPKPPIPVSEDDIDALRSKLKEKMSTDIDKLCEDAKRNIKIKDFVKLVPVISMNED